MKTLKVLLQEVVSGIKAWVNSNFAQESNTVHKTGNETVNGDKYLTGYIRHTLTYDCIQATAFDVRTDPEANRGRDIFRFWEGDSSSLGDYLGGMSYYQETDGSSRLQLICFGYPTTGNPSQQRINFHAYRDGTGSFYPVRNDVNLGTSTNQWNNFYANNYYYNGTAWGLDKANEWTQSQYIISNTNKSLVLRNTSYVIGDATPQSDIELASIIFRGSTSVNCGYLTLVHSSSGDVYSRWAARFKYTDGVKSTSGESIINGIDVGLTDSGQKFVRPMNTSSNTDLGTSEHKWKTLNGINPGALSLPDKSKAMGIDTTNFAYGSDFTFTPTVSGWLFISVTNCTKASLKTGVGEYFFNQSSDWFRDTIPVIAGEKVTLLLFSTATSKPTITLFPCLGNV